MKTNQLRQLIREEISNIINEGKEVKMDVYGLKQSEDGRFNTVIPFVYFNTSVESEAKQLADEYTNDQFSKYPGFYSLEKIRLNFYEKR